MARATGNIGGSAKPAASSSISSNSVDIWITELEGKKKIQIPWLPDEIHKRGNKTRFAQYEILDKGEVYVPIGKNLRGYSWESMFPGSGRKGHPAMRGSWTGPKEYISLLDKWKEDGTPLRLLVTGTPINVDVYLEDYDGYFSGGYGDFNYEISFLDKEELVLESTAVSTSESKVETKRSDPQESTYTIKSGDCLWNIAKAKLGSGSRWKEIYNLNKDVIESTANKYRKGKGSNNGNYIYPGTVIKIPAK